MKTTVSNLKSGDIFKFDNQEQVAAEKYINGCDCLWVTNRDCYITKEKADKGYTYGYTSAYIISIKKNDIVDIIGNMNK